MAENVEIRIDGPIIEIMLNKPPANAIDVRMSEELYEAFKRLDEDDTLRVGILSARPNPKKIFCGGWDLKAFAAEGGYDEKTGFDLGSGGIGGLPEFWDLCKPVIVAVDGAVVGGGLEMLLGADLILASPESKFFLPEVHLGFLPDGGAIQRLHWNLPRNVAADMILTGRKMTAEEGQRFGWIREVVSSEQISSKAMELAEIIANGAPLAVKAWKEFWRFNSCRSPEQAHAETHLAWKGEGHLEHYKRMLNSDDFYEGAASFIEKRSPVFKGR